MFFNCNLRNGIVYVPTVVKTEAGFYMDVEPVSVVPVSNTEGLRGALQDIIARGNVIVPTPKRNDYGPPLLPKYAGLKTDGAFMRGATQWSIKEKDGNYQIVGYRVHKDGYWVEDADQRTDLPPGSTVDDVIDRMIAILQDAARST